MNEEEKVKQQLEEKFPFLKEAVVIKRKGRIFLELAQEKFPEVFSYAVKEMQFNALSTITGMDLGNAFSLLYHLSREGRVMLNLRIILNRENPMADTVTRTFPGADIYEREILDLLGIQFKGLVAADRYPLSDNWPKNVYPLRKDWNAPSQGQEVKDA